MDAERLALRIELSDVSVYSAARQYRCHAGFDLHVPHSGPYRPAGSCPTVHPAERIAGVPRRTAVVLHPADLSAAAHRGFVWDTRRPEHHYVYRESNLLPTPLRGDRSASAGCVPVQQRVRHLPRRGELEPQADRDHHHESVWFVGTHEEPTADRLHLDAGAGAPNAEHSAFPEDGRLCRSSLYHLPLGRSGFVRLQRGRDLRRHYP